MWILPAARLRQSAQLLAPVWISESPGPQPLSSCWYRPWAQTHTDMRLTPKTPGLWCPSGSWLGVHWSLLSNIPWSCSGSQATYSLASWAWSSLNITCFLTHPRSLQLLRSDPHTHTEAMVRQGYELANYLEVTSSFCLSPLYFSTLVPPQIT